MKNFIRRKLLLLLSCLLTVHFSAQGQTILTAGETIEHSLEVPIDITIPSDVDSITISLKGGDGGKVDFPQPCNTIVRGGEGAAISATYRVGDTEEALEPGGILKLIAGQHGENRNPSCANGVDVTTGGGGASAVLYLPPDKAADGVNWVVLAVAGGGGGGLRNGSFQKQKGQGGRATTAGGNADDSRGGDWGRCPENYSTGIKQGRGGNIGCNKDIYRDGGCLALTAISANPATDLVKVLPLPNDYIEITAGGGPNAAAKGGTGFSGGGTSGTKASGGGGGFGGGACYEGLSAGGGGSYVEHLFLGASDVSVKAGGDGRGHQDENVHGFASIYGVPKSEAICNPTVEIVLDENGEGLLSVSDVDNGSIIPTGGSHVLVAGTIPIPEPFLFECTSPRSFPIQLLVRDAENNILDICTSNFSLVDTLTPTAICQDVTIQVDENGDATLDANALDGGSSDNCEYNISFEDGSIQKIYDDCITSITQEYTETIKVTDSDGNISTCTSIVTVEDSVPPVIICKDTTVTLNENGSATSSTFSVFGGASDNCSLEPTNFSVFPLNCGFVGELEVTLTAKDKSGNEASCTGIVTIVDTTAPTVITQNITIQLDDNQQAFIEAEDINNGSTDACGIQSMSVFPNSFDCENVGNNTVTLTVTDVNGNVRTKTASVTVEDKLPPTINISDFTVELDEFGNVSNPIYMQFRNQISDECTPVSISAGPTRFACEHVGMNPITIVATDQSGNESTKSITVTVEDNRPPSVSEKNATVQLNASGMASIIPNDVISLQPFDICGIQSVSVSPNTFNCQNVGENTVTLTVVDQSGNTTTKTAMVVVEDMIAPEITCVENTEREMSISQSAYTIQSDELDPLVNDNCGFVLTNNLNSSSSLSGYRLSEGVHEIIWTATDNSQNVSTCMTRITINRPAAKIMAYVWDDQNGDGVQNSNEPGIEGVEVAVIRQSDGTELTRNTTANNGKVIFTDLGDYNDERVRLKFMEKENYRMTLKDKGGDDTKDSDADRNSGLTGVFTIAPSTEITKWDAGLWSPGQVEAYVWDDQNGDGVQDSDEPAIGGVEVTLLESNNNVIAMETTGRDGIARFSHVPADRALRLHFAEPNSYRFTLKDKGGDDTKDSDADRNSGRTGTFQAKRGNQTYDKMDAGLWSPGQVEAYVWNDQNGDGVQNINEPPIEDVNVDLLRSDNSFVATATTQSNGIATFSNVPTDQSFKLKFYAPEGLAFTLKDKGGDDTTDSDADRNSGRTGTFQANSGAQTHTKIDAGFWGLGQVEAYAWDDQNGDGIQNSDEPPLANVQVELLESDNVVLATTYTGTDGIARFSDVPTNRAFRLRFYEPQDLRFTLKDKGEDDKKDSDADRNSGRTGTFQAKTGNQTHTKVDAGFWSHGTVEAYVWVDEDGNGIQNNGELGQEGVEVELLKANNSVLAMTTTRANGLAIFSNVPADQKLRLRFYTPDGFILTLKDKGDDDRTDSDADRNSGRTGTFQASMGKQTHTKMDAGILPEQNSRMLRPEEEKTPILNDISMKAYPNPFINSLTIEWEGPLEEAQISIYNLNGQIVWSQRHTLQSHMHFQLNHLPEGMYILQVIGDDFKQEMKVVRE